MNKSNLKNLDKSQWGMFFSGLVLVVGAFYIPRASPLYGGGAGSIGIAFILFAVLARASWTVALFSSLSTLLCIASGIAYLYTREATIVLSLIGVSVAVVVLATFVRQRLNNSRI
jgi:hypothetical protein